MMCFVISYLYGEMTAAHIPFVHSKHYYRKKKHRLMCIKIQAAAGLTGFSLTMARLSQLSCLLNC